MRNPDPDVFWTLSSDISVNTNGRGGSREKVICCAISFVQETQIQRKPETHQRKAYQSVPWHTYIVSNAKITLSKINLRTAVLRRINTPAVEMWLSKMQLGSCSLLALFCSYTQPFLGTIGGWLVCLSNLKVAIPDTTYLKLSTERSIAVSHIFPTGTMHTAAQHGWLTGSFKFPAGSVQTVLSHVHEHVHQYLPWSVIYPKH